jgi:hypothetical protein
MKKIIAFIKGLFTKQKEFHVGKYAEIKKELIEKNKTTVKKKKKKKKTNESK